MNFLHFTAGLDDGGRRIDKIVRRFISKESLSGIYGGFRKGLIKLNGKKVSPDCRVESEDILEIAEVLLKKNCENEKINTVCDNCKEFAFPFDIVFQNQHILAINKPYDISVHGKENSIDNIVKQFYFSRESRNKSLTFVPGPLHRIDRRTTGLLIFSWSMTGARFVSTIFAEGTVKKSYIALVQGKMSKEMYWQDEIIDKEEIAKTGFKTVEIAQNKYSDSKTSITKAFPLDCGKFNGEYCSLILFEIETGRKHQIRAQSAYHGFPLLGDTAYGGNKIYEKQRLFLHSYELGFPENRLNLPLQLCAPLHAEFKFMLDKIGINNRAVEEKLQCAVLGRINKERCKPTNK
ncbi:MAG: RluA family pseudouridine synthase [Treponema sp.]